MLRLKATTLESYQNTKHRKKVFDQFLEQDILDRLLQIRGTNQFWCLNFRSTIISSHFLIVTLYVHLNKYETAPNFIQLSQNLTSDCLLISMFLPILPVSACCDHKIVLQIKTKQFYDHIMQKLVKTGKNTEINKQSNVNFWLDWRNGTVSYSFSCTITKSEASNSV